MINVDEVIDSMIASAAVGAAGIPGEAAQVPKIAEHIVQACHEKLQVYRHHIILYYETLTSMYLTLHLSYDGNE